MYLIFYRNRNTRNVHLALILGFNHLKSYPLKFTAIMMCNPIMDINEQRYEFKTTYMGKEILVVFFFTFQYTLDLKCLKCMMVFCVINYLIHV